MALPENKPYCLYSHLKPCGEVFYVGIGSTLKRPYEKTNRNVFWKRVVSKYEDFTVEVIEENLTKEDACTKEIELITKFGRRDLGEGTLVNLTDGGESTYGRVMEQWQKDQMSKAMIGKSLGEENPNYGNYWTEEAKANMSAIISSKYKSGEMKPNLKALEKGRRNKEINFKKDPSKKLLMAKRVSENKSLYDYLKIDYITGEILEEFSSYLELKNKYPKVGKTVIMSVCNGHKVSYRGFLWRYRKKSTGKVIVPKLKSSVGYKQYFEHKGKTFLKIMDASKYFSIGYSTIRSKFIDIENKEFNIIPISHPYLNF